MKSIRRKSRKIHHQCRILSYFIVSLLIYSLSGSFLSECFELSIAVTWL